MGSTASKTAERPGRCPECGQPAPRRDNDAFPFCSSRCRLADLDRWLEGDYRIPGPPTFESIDE